MTPEILFRDVEVDGRRCDVVVAGGRIASVTPHGSEETHAGETVDGKGGVLLPGLHDHHVHLRSLTAARRSVSVDALGSAEPGTDGWIRVAGYHDGLVAVPLDRQRLDELRADVPVRVQHRSGQLWIVNSPGARALGLPAGHDGRLYRADDWLRARLPRVSGDTAGLAGTGRLLAAYGVVGVTDATVSNTEADASELMTLPQRVLVMNVHGLRKLVLYEADLPELRSFVDTIREAHDSARAVAIHAVTRVELAFAVAALREAGSAAGDRIEHAGVCPPELAEQIRSLGPTVVTQPHFPVERAEQYGTEVDAADRAWLYPGRLLRDVGVPLAAGTDAPFGHPDPWRAIRAAVDLWGFSSAEGLDLFLGPLEEPGGRPRRVVPGVTADLCLLHSPLAAALERHDSSQVRAVWIDGRRVDSTEA